MAECDIFRQIPQGFDIFSYFCVNGLGMIIGRETEIKLLNDAYKSSDAQFVAVYGRRRVGKTYLIREVFADKILFQHAGLANSEKEQQMAAWVSSLKDAGAEVQNYPKNWIEAFGLLKLLIRSSKRKKKVIFIDELPWMDTQHSGFLPALEFFWNAWASAQKNIMLVVCGSATSWIINKLIHNHGGLHNRITLRIKLSPFNLRECALYAESRNLKFTQKQILECYMALGGIPFYWSFLKKGKSAVQNINDLFFAPEGSLNSEFQELYHSLFRYPEPYVKVIKALGKKRIGLTRSEIIKAMDIPDNGNLTKVLSDLEYCGFIKRYSKIGSKTKNSLYQLIDYYTLFYFQFIDGNPNLGRDYWLRCQTSQQYSAWSGLAFERVCFSHFEQIKRALGISGVECTCYPWYSSDAQIDMVIDRKDDIMNLCEMKYYKTKFSADADFEEDMLDKMYNLIDMTKTRKAVHLTLVTINGAIENQYMNEIQNILDIKDLFA